MRGTAKSLTLAFVLLLSSFESSAQETPPTFPSDTQVVLLDVIATGRDGRLLDDLRRDELQVSEDGKTCEILSLRLVRPRAAMTAPREEPALTPGAPSTPAPPAPQATPTRANLVVLVFDRLTTESAPLARKGALRLLEHSFPADTWFAIFKVGYGVRLLTPFTTDVVRLRSAIEVATLGDVALRLGPLAPPLPPVAPATEQPAGPTAIPIPDLRPVADSVGGEEQALARRVDGLDSLYAVLGIARALGTVQGRKALVYFAEGWHLPVAAQAVYDDAISAANRANVAVHTVDTRGLVSRRPKELTPTDSVLGGFRADQRGGPGAGSTTPRGEAGGGGGESNVPLLKAIEDREEALSGPTLERLADDTGGLAVANTNDLGAGLLRVAEELRQYYEVVYAPTNSVLDGRFRRISVKVSRPGVTLRTRAGYFATPGGSPALTAYELPLMAALGDETPARSFTLRAGVLHFAPKGNERECVVLAEVPLGEVQLLSDEAAGRYRGHLSLLGYLKDDAGHVVARLTHDWPIEGPLPEREKARQTTAVFRRTLPLAPGRYVLEAAVQDRQSGGTSVKRMRFDVPAVGSGLALASPTLLRGVNTAAPAAAADDPLRVGDLSLSPGLGAPFVLGSSPALPVYLGVYPGASVEPIELTVELRRGTDVVARAAPGLPPVDAGGRIPWLGGIPVDRLQPGAYELAVTAQRGEATVEERTTIEIVPGRSQPTAIAAAQDAPPQRAQPAAAHAQPAAQPDPALARVLERAARYVVDYEESFRNIVAEETYSQQSEVAGSSRVDPFSPSGRALATSVYQRRVTRADLVFVRLAGDIPWGLFRDVFELNGKKVRDRDERLQKLFQQPSPSALQQAHRILEESARYNIGGAWRTLNLPTLSLLFLHARNQGRFAFGLGQGRRIAGVETVEVRFDELVRPALVTDASGGDLPAKGRFWIDPLRGTVLRSEVVFRFEPNLAEGSIETEYRRQPRLGMWVPSEMKEKYEDLRGARRAVFRSPTQAEARYSNFRQFSVTTEEKARLPPE